MTRLWCESAFVDGRVQSSVSIEIENGRFRTITPDREPGDALRLSGFTMPGMANAHSHAFHRALRSRTQAERGTFWTWREVMYRAASRLDPDRYHRLARATFAEMAMAGITCVGEFHYLHHQLDGTPYGDPNEMGRAILAAASAVGIRITLLDTLYLHGALGVEGYSSPSGTQLRFDDGNVDSWVERVDMLSSIEGQQVGGAIHSVRAVDPESMAAVGRWATAAVAPVHAHVSEQVAENEACLQHHGRTPIGLFAASGLLSPRFTAVHATHLADADIDALAGSGAMIAMCPTTERDLGDGIGPTHATAGAEIPISLGTDSHAVIDLFEETRLIELHERLRSEKRGIHRVGNLIAMATVNGHRSLGWHDAGSIVVGNRADLVSVRLDSIRTAGISCESAAEATVFAATASDVTDVFVDGRHIVAEGRHRTIDVANELDASIKDLLDDD